MRHRLKLFARLAASGFFIAAGIAHLVKPAPFVAIVPPMLPWPEGLVAISGACEIAGGTGLLIPPLRTAASRGLVALLVAVFPANVYMATNHIQFHGFPSQPWMAWARLPVQAVFIAWVLWCATPDADTARNPSETKD